MLDQGHAQRGEGFGAHPEPGRHHDGVGGELLAVRQLDGGDVAVVAGDQAPNLRIDDGHAGGAQGLDARVVGGDAVVQHQGQPVAELAEQTGRVEPDRAGDDLDDALVAHLVAVAERAVDDVAAPVLGHALDVGQLVDQPGGGQHPAGQHHVAADQLEAEAVVVGAGHVEHPALDHLAAVAAHLLATDGGQLRRRRRPRGRGSRACGRRARCGARRRR